MILVVVELRNCSKLIVKHEHLLLIHWNLPSADVLVDVVDQMVLNAVNISKLIEIHAIVHCIHVHSILNHSSHLHCCWTESIVFHLSVYTSVLIASADKVIVSFLVIVETIVVFITSREIIYISNWVVSNNMIVVHHLIIRKHGIGLMMTCVKVTCEVRLWLVGCQHWVLERTSWWHGSSNSCGAMGVWNDWLSWSASVALLQISTVDVTCLIDKVYFFRLFLVVPYELIVIKWISNAIYFSIEPFLYLWFSVYRP